MGTREDIVIEEDKYSPARKRELIKHADQLSIEEFKNLRGQIDDTIRSIRNLELFAIAGIATYYGWLLAHPILSGTLTFLGTEISVSTIFLSVPIGASLLVALRVYADTLLILHAADYLAIMERKFAKICSRVGSDDGWETYLRRIRSQKDREYRKKNQNESKITIDDYWNKWLFTYEKALKVGWSSFYTQILIMSAVVTATILLLLYERQSSSRLAPSCDQIVSSMQI